MSCDDYGLWFKETQSSDHSNIMRENAILETLISWKTMPAKGSWAFKWLQSASVSISFGFQGPRVWRKCGQRWFRGVLSERSKVSSARRFKSTSRVLLLTSIVEMLLSFPSHRECSGYVKLQEVQCRSAETYKPHLGRATDRWPPRHEASLR